MVSGYLLGFAALMITAGAWATGPAASGCSWRALASSARQPGPQACLRDPPSSPPRGWSRMRALDGAMAGFASAIRLILGGVLSDANLFGWRWRAVFFLNVPVALVTLAMTAETAGGASGLSSTAQQLGGAIGMALLGTIFYWRVTPGTSSRSQRRTGRHTRFGAFAMCAALSLLLPRTAVAEDTLLGRWRHRGAPEGLTLTKAD